jgi:serine phosphatase RsbU (regulator of sigma subunit)
LTCHDRVSIGVGDVTGHGLESGMVMLMAQTAIRTLMTLGETDAVKILNVVNQVIYANTQRMKTYKNMTLVMLNYAAGVLRLSGQHENVIIIRSLGQLEIVDTLELGFPLGLEPDITSFIAETEISLQTGDVVILYTDGIPEAMNQNDEQYGLDRLYVVLKQHAQHSAQLIREAVIEDVRRYVGDNRLSDDITLVVIKQK